MLEGCQINHTISIDSVYTFFKSDFKSDYVFGGERHNFWEIVFVLDGTVGVTAEDEVFVLETNFTKYGQNSAQTPLSWC